MKEASQTVACVVDHGLFLPIALKLGEQLSRVFYWSPHERSMVKMEEGFIGKGYPTIVPVQDVWEIKNECDFFVFPDIGFSGLQKELISQGFPVWGHHGGDELETNRGKFLKTLETLGLEMPTYTTIRGLTSLRAHLVDKTDKYIKVSKWRGDWETLHWRSWSEDEGTLDAYAFKMGPAKEFITFFVFDPIDTDIEDGLDMYCIDGKYPSLVMHGMECKDKSYLAAVQEYEKVPEPVRRISDAYAPVLASYGYRGFFSFETRIKDDKSFFIDPTCRAASPPVQCMVNLFENLGEIMWAGANGECVDPKPRSNFAGQVLISTDREPGEWTVMEIPEEISDNVKIAFSCVLDGRVCIPPHALGNMLGWVTAEGDTIEEFVHNIKEYAEKLPEGFECDTRSLVHLIEEIQSAEEKGMEFTDQPVPEPQEVL